VNIPPSRIPLFTAAVVADDAEKQPVESGLPTAHLSAELRQKEAQDENRAN